jgi:hypothetical protein
MNIPLLKKENVSDISLQKSFSDIENLNSGSKNELTINFKDSKLNFSINFDDEEDQFLKNDALVETFEFYENLLEKACNESLNISEYTMFPNMAEFTINLNKNDIPVEIIENTIIRVNQGLESVVESELGKGFEKFIKMKEDEAHDEMLIDYEIKIRKIVYSNLSTNFSNYDVNLILNSTALTKKFDTKENKIEFSNNSSTKLKIPESYDKIKSNSFIEEIVFLQKNNNRFVRLEGSDKAKELMKELCTKATKEFYSNPRYKETNNDKLFNFIGRVNDGKGNDADVLVNKKTKEVMLMTEDYKYSSLEFIRQNNPVLCVEVNNLHKDFLEKSNKIKIKIPKL